jgi:hypothetical protein
MPYSYERIVRKNCIDTFTLREIAIQIIPPYIYPTLSIDDILDWYTNQYLPGLVQNIISDIQQQSKKL